MIKTNADSILPKKSHSVNSQSLSAHENELKNLQDKLQKCRKELHNEKMRSSRLQLRLDENKKKKCTVDEFLQNEKISDFSKALIKLQFKKSCTPFTQIEKDLCKILYYHSAANYNQMRKLGIGLAAPSTVRGWVSEYDVRAGLNDVILQKLESKLKSLPPEERMCALKFDELTIKSFEEYSKKLDEVEGFSDIGSFRRDSTIAKHALLFCLDSINAKNNWRQLLFLVLTRTEHLQQIFLIF